MEDQFQDEFGLKLHTVLVETRGAKMREIRYANFLACIVARYYAIIIVRNSACRIVYLLAKKFGFRWRESVHRVSYFIVNRYLCPMSYTADQRRSWSGLRLCDD